MADAPALDALLSHRPLGRVLTPDSVQDEFALIRQAWENEKKALPTAEEFRRVGRGSGTHLLKLISPLVPADQAVLRFSAPGSNSRPAYMPSLDAKMAAVAKIVYRPLEIDGASTRSLVEHILMPDELSAAACGAFAEVFGQEALDALRSALLNPLPVVRRLPAAEFPIIYLPRPGGGDLQATPVAPAEAYVLHGRVTAPFFQQGAAEEGGTRRGHWHKQHVSAKPQNISGAIGRSRTRFMATLPKLFAPFDAALYRYARGGAFPPWNDVSVAEAVEGYANRLHAILDHSNKDIRKGLVQRADDLILGARRHAKDVLDEIAGFGIEGAPKPPPRIADIILDRSWPGGRDGEAFAKAVQALASDHFRNRLRESGADEELMERWEQAMRARRPVEDAPATGTENGEEGGR